VARIKLELPERFPFQTEVQVLEAHLHRGIHLGNAALFSLINDARMSFFESMGYSEVDVEGAGTIMSDAVVVYKSESFAGDLLRLEVTAGDFSRVGCDLFYRVTNAVTGVEVARAKTAIGFVDYGTRKLLAVPEAFKSRFV
jgi:4-hydroxybenzoyl-CoA thioesterase